MALRLRGVCVVLAVSFAGVASLPAHAAAKTGRNVGTTVSVEKFPAAAATESVATATSLMRYGYANKDPLALITGARIMKTAGLSASAAKRVEGTAGAAKGKNLYTAESALAKARELAGGRADLIALADDVGTEGSRGAIDGPGSTTTVVNRMATDRFQVTFRGGQPARVVVSGDGDSDLDLYVHDENGNQVCADEDETDDMLCSFTPKWTGRFTIRVKNRGVANEYRIVHN